MSDGGSIDATFADVLDQAERAWPGLGVDPSAFQRYLAARLTDGALHSIRTADLYLACACASGHEGAIAALEKAYFHDCDAALARMAQDPDFASEVKQRARTKLFVAGGDRAPRIEEYAGRGELRTFLRVLVMREAISLRRKDRRDPAERAAEEPRLETADPELLHMRKKYAAEFESSFREAVAALSSEERNLLRYHYLDRLNIDHIGAIYGIHRVSAARRLTKIRELLVESTRGRLAERLRIDGGELKSVLKLIESQVDISLRRALGDASAS